MKRIFWLGLVPAIALVASGASWMTGTESPSAGALRATPDADAAVGGHAPARSGVGTAISGPQLTRPAAPRPSHPIAVAVDDFSREADFTPDPSRAVPADPGDNLAYNLDNPFDTQLLAAALRARGISEHDVLYAMKYPDDAADLAAIGDPTQGQAYDLSDPYDAALLAESLSAKELNEEDRQYALKRAADDSAPLDGAEGQVYDPNDPADREALVQSLVTQGVQPQDMAYVMKEQQDVGH